MKTELDPFIVKNILGCPTVSSCPVSSSSGVDPVVVLVHGAVGGICLLLLTWSHPWLVEVVVRCIHIWSWRNVDPGLGLTASSCPVSSDVDPVVCGDT